MKKANLSENSEVEIENKDGPSLFFLVKKKLSLDTLLNEITKDKFAPRK
ncbi:MAG: hypothetical protein HOP07_18575 [Bacteriovoracaceae bacterium]|nr:hypothetical protein [Bacteriovoracaceae bacterium]